MSAQPKRLAYADPPYLGWAALQRVRELRDEMATALIETGKRNLTGFAVDALAVCLTHLDRALAAEPGEQPKEDKE